mgnify:CR=1 FL=1
MQLFFHLKDGLAVPKSLYISPALSYFFKVQPICKIVYLLVSNFASILFDFDLRERLVKQTDAQLLTKIDFWLFDLFFRHEA